MRRLTGIKLCLLVMLCLSLPAVVLVPASAPAAAAQNSKNASRVLLVYDSLGVDSPAAGNIEALQRMLLSLGATVTTIASDAYKPEMAEDYAKLVTVCNTEDLCGSITAGMAAFTGEWLHIGPNPPEVLRGKLALRTETASRQSLKLSVGGLFEDHIFVNRLAYITEGKGETYGQMTSSEGAVKTPFAVSAGGYAYVPYFESGNLSELAVAYVLRTWLGVEAPTQSHLLIRGITPFIDLDRLEALSEQLYNAGIPFLVSVSPLFNNTDYPAMQRYLAALQTVQSYNGSVLVQVPTPTSAGQDPSILKTQMDGFLNHLADAGIAPLGMTGDMKRAQEKEGREAGFAFSDTTILFANESGVTTRETEAVQPFAASPYTMPASVLLQISHENKIWPAFPVNLAVTFDWFESDASQEEAVREAAGSWLPFADFKSETHSLSSSAHKAESRSGALLLDGKPADLQDQAEPEEQAAVVAQPEQKVTFHALFSVQSRILIVLIITTLMLFAVFLLIGYRLYKKKYYKSGGGL
ncbi:hypothetical protein [Paenibacillus sp. JDR-2]|uniref:hypothetical protein n=1 Tax=Paenibacillus sp. (strain JDR-2) TaxID=324057 RepID=UPI000166B19F|nr:hypothetical protein [Paenibacillus sp. JDR-2]ACS99256.1 conserved hypothetical protein [Paenibacillus sp. JDR-2]